ncbi:MAG: hypothetical protein ACYST6_10335 [Planctomycetota bacterium]|jgi:hypothetical protein
MKKLLLMTGLLVVLLVIGLCLWYQRNTRQGLSGSQIKTVKSLRDKYENNLTPSDREVKEVAEILANSNLSDDQIERLLGKPAKTRKVASAQQQDGSHRAWDYVVGYSRIMSIVFDSNGQVVSIQGVGVGFDTLTVPNEHQ